MAERGTADVAIVLVNWNGWRDTIDAIRGCLALERGSARLRIIVCDNGSSDGSLDHIANWATGIEYHLPSVDWPLPIDPDLRPTTVVRASIGQPSATDTGATSDASALPLILIDTGANLGFSGGNNVGIRWAMQQGCSHIWLLNNDAVPERAALQPLLGACAKDAAVLAGSLLLDLCAPPRVQALAGAMDMRTFSVRRLGNGMDPASQSLDASVAALATSNEIAFPVGASMMATRKFIEDVGLLSEDYFLYYEEPDWVLRANAAGAKVTFVPASRAYHRHGASAGASLRTMAVFYRSRLRACARFAPARRWSVWFDIALNAAKDLARGRTSPARAAFQALSGQVVVPYSAPSGHVL